MQPFSVMPATADDCAECARLLVEQLNEHRIDASAERLTSLLKDVVADATRGSLIVARVDGRIVGVAYMAVILSVEHCGPVAWLEELFVAPNYRNQGIGTALVTAVVEKAQEMGLLAIDLEIDVEHERAISLYQRFGFHYLDRSRWVTELTE